jgi:large subunit ribosomal protein L6
VAVKGPKASLRAVQPGDVGILEGGKLSVARPSEAKTYRALHGLTRSLLANMVQGVTHGFEKSLEVNGVGYRAEKDGSNWCCGWALPTPWSSSPALHQF